MANYSYKCSCGATCDLRLSDKDYFHIQGEPMIKWLKTHADCVKNNKQTFYRLPVKRNGVKN